MFSYTKSLPELVAFDVVVVGSGSAGATAAIAAGRAGVRTLLLEIDLAALRASLRDSGAVLA